MHSSGSKFDVLMTSVPPEAKGGIFAIHQVLSGQPLRHDINISFFAVSSANPFKEGLISRIIRVIVRTIQFTGLLIRNKSIRIIHVNTSFDRRSLLRDAFFVIISRLFGRKIILQIHSRIMPADDKVIDVIMKYVIPLCNNILVFSQESKKALTAFVPEKNLEIFPNPVIVSDFTNKDSSYKNDLLIPEECGMVLFLSRLIKEKGVYDLIESIPNIIKKYESVYFVFAGEGPDRQAMETRCKTLGIENNVRFTGHIQYEDVKRAFSCSDIFVLPTYYPEGMPMAILQALAAGLPIISTPISSIPDIIVNGENGFLVEPKNPYQLAEKILFLMNRKELREKMGDANIRLAKKEYDLGIIIGKLEQLYISIS